MSRIIKHLDHGILALVLDGRPLAVPEKNVLALLVPPHGIEVRYLAFLNATSTYENLAVLTVALSELHAALADLMMSVATAGVALDAEYSRLIYHASADAYSQCDWPRFLVGITDLEAAGLRLASVTAAEEDVLDHLEKARTGGLALEAWADSLYTVALQLDMIADTVGLADALHARAEAWLGTLGANGSAEPLSA